MNTVPKSMACLLQGKGSRLDLLPSNASGTDTEPSRSPWSKYLWICFRVREQGTERRITGIGLTENTWYH